MKKLILAGLLLSVVSVKGGDMFGAALKPDPNITLLGQNVACGIPSLAVGKDAGVIPDFELSSEGVRLKIPYLAIKVPFPKFTLSSRKAKHDLVIKPGSIKKETK